MCIGSDVVVVVGDFGFGVGLFYVLVGVVVLG